MSLPLWPLFVLPSRPIVVPAVLRLQPFGKSRLEGLEEARPLTAAAGRGARGMVPTGSGFLASCKSVPTTQAHVPSTLLSWVSQLKTAFWHGRGLGPRNVLAQGCRRLVSRDGKTGPQQMMVERFELAGLPNAIGRKPVAIRRRVVCSEVLWKPEGCRCCRDCRHCKQRACSRKLCPKTSRRRAFEKGYDV